MTVTATAVKTTAVKVAIAKAISTKATVSVTVRIIAIRIIAVGVISIVWIGIVRERDSKAVKEEEPVVEVAIVDPIAAKAQPQKATTLKAAATSPLPQTPA